MRSGIRASQLWLAAALVLGIGGTGGGTVAHAAPAAQDACFKQVFQKRAEGGSWLLHECEGDNVLRLRIAFRGPQARGDGSALLRETEGIVGVDYRLVGPTTLLVDASAERGGRAFLVHPVEGSGTLSIVEFHYMSDDEESLEVRQAGRRIRASTRHGTQVFTIDARGVVKRAPPPPKPPRPPRPPAE